MAVKLCMYAPEADIGKCIGSNGCVLNFRSYYLWLVDGMMYAFTDEMEHGTTQLITAEMMDQCPRIFISGYSLAFHVFRICPR